MTSPRNKWTAERIRAARCTALQPLLKQMEYPMQAMQNGNIRVYDLPKEILIKETYWVCPATGNGGNAIDLLVQVMGMSFSEAMHKLEEFMEP